MPVGENAGGIYVTIDADNQPLISKLGQTETIARKAGENIAEGFSQGAQGSEKLATSIISVGESASHSVPEISAMSGAIRVLSGEQSIRAIERLGVSVLGLGKAAQAAFPLIGAIAVGELVTRVYERFSRVSDNEKEAAESARKFTDEIQAADDRVGKLDEDIARLKDGAVAGLGVALNNAMSSVAEKVNAAKAAQEALKGPPTVSGVGASGVDILSHGASSSTASPAALAAQAAAAQLTEAIRKVDAAAAELDKAKKEAADKAAKEQADDQARVHEEFIEAEKDFDRRTAEENRKAEEESRKHAEAMKAARDLQIRELADDGRLMDEQIRRNQESARAESEAQQRQATLAQRTGQIAIENSGVGAESQNEIDKLKAQQQYASQLVHTKAQEIAYAEQMAAFDEKALQIKISIAQMELIQAIAEQNLIPTREGELKIEEDSLKIAQAKAVLAKQEIEDETKLAGLKQKESLSGQIIGKVGTGPGNLVDAANIQIANTTATAIDGISAALGRAAQGGQSFSKIMQQLGKSILGEIVSGIVKIGLQMAVTAAIGKSATTAIAATEAAQAAGLGAAWAFVSVLAALPFPANVAAAPGIAAAEGAQILAIGVPKFDKGGPINEDQLAMVHKGEYVLTADQVSGRTDIPSFGGGGIGSAPFTNTMSVNSASSAFSIGAIHLHGVRDMQDVARRLPNVLKAASSSFQPASR